VNQAVSFFVNDTQVPYREAGALNNEQYQNLIETRFQDTDQSRSVDVGGSTCLVKRRVTDSAVLGVDVWELNFVKCINGRAADLLKAISEIIPTGAVLTCLVESKNTELLMELQSCGAIVMGSNVSWGFNRNLVNVSLLSSSANYSKLTSEHEASYQACVRDSFGNYRSHYHLNEDTRATASDLYVNQVFSSTKQNSDVIINLKSDKVVAFSTINFHEEAEYYLGANRVAEIGFSGVDREEANKGLYSTNVKCTLTDMLERNIEWFFFGTSSFNFPVQRTWMAIGLYKPLRFSYRFHWKF